MEKDNPLYRNQGIHVLTVLFTVEEGRFKVLLLKRDNQPFKNMWMLVGGACYNNETVEDAMKREMYEKTGLKNVQTTFFKVYSEPNRSPVMRMIAIVYIGVIDCKKVKVLKKTLKTKDADWFIIDRIPPLAYDHNKILGEAIDFLKEKIFDSQILKNLFPPTFTLPEIVNAYQSILDSVIDRRNFRKKLLSEKIIEPTGEYEATTGKKPAKLYRFCDQKSQDNRNKC